MFSNDHLDIVENKDLSRAANDVAYGSFNAYSIHRDTIFNEKPEVYLQRLKREDFSCATSASLIKSQAQFDVLLTSRCELEMENACIYTSCFSGISR